MSFNFNPFTGTFDEVAPAASGVTSVNGDVGPAVSLDAVDIPYDNTASGLTSTDVQGAVDEVVLSGVFIPSSDKGAPFGVAALDGGGKVPVTQLPNSIMQYVGVWNAFTNSPLLADGAGNADEDIGNVYRVGTAGTQDLGSGSQTFDVGDYVILNDSKIWEKSDTTDAVASVNGMTGIVTLDVDKVEYRTLSAGEITAKQLTLTQTPSVPTEVTMNIISGTAQAYGTDFTVSGAVVDWTGLGLDGLLAAGDKIVLYYRY